MPKLTAGQAAFLHDEPNVGVVAALREDGTPHQSVVWVDWDGEHVVLNLNNFRAKLEHMRRDPRVSVLTIDRNDPFRRLASKGTSSRSRPTAPTSTSSDRPASTSAGTTTRSRKARSESSSRSRRTGSRRPTWSSRVGHRGVTKRSIRRSNLSIRAGAS